MSQLIPPHRVKWDRVSNLLQALRKWANAVAEEPEYNGSKSHEADSTDTRDRWLVEVLGTKTRGVLSRNAFVQLRRLVNQHPDSEGNVYSSFLSISLLNSIVGVYNQHHPDYCLPIFGESSYPALEDLCDSHPAIKDKLVTWERSGKWEERAEKVLCLTYDMTWAMAHLPGIIDSLRENDHKMHSYIVTHPDWNSTSVNTVMSQFREKVYSQVDEEAVRRDILNRFKVRRLNHPSDDLQLDLWFVPPLPADIVMYARTPNPAGGLMNVVVMSAYPIEPPITQEKKDRYFDCVLSAGGYRYNFDNWFKHTWKRLSEDGDAFALDRRNG